MSNKFYVTTPIYYVNDVPHIGHAYTTLAGDILARYYREKLGKENVFFLVGTDEHGQKVAQAAEEHKKTPKEYADSVAPRFEDAWKLLNINYDYFIRTTNLEHEKIVTDLLQKIYDNGYIYEGVYEGLYCVGCEAFKTENEIVNGKCPLHPNKNLVHQKEKNYFLKLKELAPTILKKIENKEYGILPPKREHEILSRIILGVEDISISRAGVSWGIPVPWDKSQTIYVWVDALINYYSATQFVRGKGKFWPADLHLVGKDILWFHSVIWQALLIAAGIKELPKTIFAHGFFTIDGQKMSKSLGNVISPKQLVDRYGIDGARYLIISAYAFGDDDDISISRFDEKFNADLANGLGNLIARVSTLAQNSKFKFPTTKQNSYPDIDIFLTNCQFDKSFDSIWAKIKELDTLINEKKVWELKGKELEKILEFLVNDIRQIAIDLKPFLPETAEKIEKQFKGPIIKKGEPLFPRLK